jgi:general secretion pathway protein K
VVFPIDGGQLSASLRDLKGCFNVNILANVPDTSQNTANQQITNNDKPTPGQQIFSRLLQSIELNLDDQPDYSALAARLRDWIDDNQQPTGFEGREDEEYSGYLQPYRTADQLLVSTSELRTISGFEPELIEQIMPYLCAIPNHQDITINVNTIDPEQPELLASFYTNLSLDQARSILSARPANGFEEEDYSPLVPADAALIKGAAIVFESNFFAALIEVQLGNPKSPLKSIFQYDKSGPTVQLLARLGHND